jgi:hypothetical protein
MPLPAGFVPEEALKTEAKASPTLPHGFVDEGSVIPQINEAPPAGIMEKVSSFFRNDDKLSARAGNVYALSELTGLPLHEVNKNYDILRYSTKITGLEHEPREEDVMKALMIPGVVAGAVANPVGTAAGLIAFGALDKAIPTDKIINKMEEDGVSDEAVKAVELADFVGKSIIAGGLFKKIDALPENFLKRKITEYKLPEVVTLKPEQVQDIYKTGELTTADEKSLWAALELNSFDRRAALEHGININVPSEKIVRVVDNPLWAKVKNMFGMAEEGTVAKTTEGKPTKAPAGLLEGPNATTKPQEPPGNPVKKLIDALKSAEDVRSKQETLHAEGRAKQFAKLQSARSSAKGEKGFFKELGALKGELPKVEFEAIRGKVGQADIDALFNQIRTSPKIGEWEKITAQGGLAKMFGENGGRVPTEGELSLLNEVFGKEFTEAVLEKRPFWSKMKDLGLEIANIPRSLMSSFDLSAPLRQGIFFIGRQKQFGPAFKSMLGAFVDKKAYQNIQDVIIAHPDYQLARDSKLALTDMDVLLGTREERFMSNMAEKIPVIGEGVKASGRAYIGFLNKLRFDVFTDLVNKADLLGLDPRKNRDLANGIADFINNATGRGTLPGGLSRSAVTLNSIFFSPRLMFSRLNLLNPAFYVKQDPFVRKEALASLFTYLGLGLSVLTLAKLAGADVGDEPRSSDFGKVKIGNTRFDIWGGFQPMVRSAAQIVTGKYISSTTGKEMTLGEGYKPLTREEIIQRFLEGKLAPIPSFVVTLLKQQDQAGKPVDVPKELRDMFIPMMLQDLNDLAHENPALLPLGLLGFFGVGVQTYGADAKKKTSFSAGSPRA